MSKEYLEALERIKKSHYTAIAVMGCERDYETEKAIEIVETALQRLDSIDNPKPSEALECLEKLSKSMPQYDSWIKYIDTIKQALLKAQYHNSINIFKGSKKVKIEIPESDLMDYNPVKQYLKWEDLEFEEARCQYSNVKLGNADFQMTCYLYKGCMKKVWIRNEIISFELKDTEEDKQFFNDLHLEMVEE